MAEEKLVRGVLVEFDFAAMNGAEILFETVKAQLADASIELTPKLEALHLAGGNYQGGLAELFQTFKCKRDPAKAAKELAAAFSSQISANAAAAVTPEFREFVSALTAKGLKVVVATRGDAAALGAALEGTGAVAYGETSMTYGSCKWDAWKRACIANGVREVLSAAVVGSGYGVKAALIAGLSALAVENPRVAYQDFGGADAVVDRLDGAAAAEILRMLKIA